MKRRDPALTNAGHATNTVQAIQSPVDILGRGGDIPGQLRRRKSASYRMAKLADGRRDPAESDPGAPLACIEARRLAWVHLSSLGLLDEHTDAMLRGVA